MYQLSGAAEAGLYGAVYQVLDRAQLVPMAVVTTLLPMLAAPGPHDRARFGQLFQDAAEFLWIAALLPGPTLVASEPLVELLFGGVRGRRPRIADPDGSLCRDRSAHWP